MESLYQGLPDITATQPENKVYGKDKLISTDPEELFGEMKALLSAPECVTQAHAVTNIVNINEQLRGERNELDETQLNRLETCMRIKYPNRIRASPHMDTLPTIEPTKRRWCVIL